MTLPNEALSHRHIGSSIQTATAALPVLTGQQMTAALAAYQDLQHAIDKAMPDQIMDLDGKKFRKKGYWRAVAVAFNISVETVEEKREVASLFKDGRENFGYVVTRRATAPNGRSVVADGTCFAVEKARRFKCPHLEREGSRRTLHFPHSSCPEFDPEFQWRVLPGDATEHNVRGHASTRAFNRAVSDLVGFGEVSAEEINSDHEDDRGRFSKGGVVVGHVVTAAAHNEAVRGNAAAVQNAQPTAHAGAGTTTVASIKEKTGKKGDKPWARRTVLFADGREAVTFSDSLTAQLEAARVSQEPVNPDILLTDKGKDLRGLLPVVMASIQTEAPEPAQEPDEPVDGPEPVLTVRKLTTERGDRWVIQTKKRQLVTQNEEHANAAVEARKAGLGILPSFEVIRTSAGHPLNRLKSFLVEVAEDREPGADG